MIIHDDIGPIDHEPVRGPAVDAWNARKEPDNANPCKAADIRANFEKLKPDIINHLRVLLFA